MRWVLAAALIAFVASADWFAGGLGPRIVQGSATVSVTSTPPGADVLLDGERVGATPLRHDGTRPGEVVVRVEHRYHEAVAQHIDIARGERREIHVDLPAGNGALEIVSNPRGAAVAIDGRPLDEAAPVLLAPHPAGAYTVSASIDGWHTQTRTVEVLPRARSEVAFELERLPVGEVFLDLTPRDAKVDIVGHDEAYHRGIRLPRGSYEFLVERDGYAGETFEMPVLRGRNQRTVTLARLKARLTIASDPPDAVVHVSYPAGAEWRDVRYSGPLTLPAGDVTIEARAVGYRNYVRRLALSGRPHVHTVHMQAFDVEPGRRFGDALASGGAGPQLVVIPAGTFRMGSVDGSHDERPAHDVAITQPFAIGVHEVTHAEYDQHRGTMPVLKQPVRGEPALPVPPETVADHPVTGVTWSEAEAYVAWLSRETGYQYRLPSEAEWEYVARAGSQTRYPFGDDPRDLCRHANIADQTLAARYRKYSTAACDDGVLGVGPVGRLEANAFGVHDMLGNAEEWVADCWRRNYTGADGTARPDVAGCSAHAVRGGAWDSAPEEATVSFRSFSTGANPARGFRIVREL